MYLNDMMTHDEFVNQIEAHMPTIDYVISTYASQLSRDDLTQEIILETWKSIGNYEKRCKFNTWLFAIARNTCVTHIRKLNAVPEISCIDDYQDEIEYEQTSDVLAKQFEQVMRYNKVVDSIAEPYRTLFLMYIKGIPYEDISRQTGITANSLRVTISRLKKRLYKHHIKDIFN